MPLPEPILDDLRFQRDLVDEARRLINRYCPEWTEYNLSDPGVTLIELFAWMAELLAYRLNQVPEKNYIRFLDLLGLQLQPASSARTEVLFRLAAPFPISRDPQNGDPLPPSTRVPAGVEISTRSVAGEPEITFTTDRDLWVFSPILTDVRRDADFANKNYLRHYGLEPMSVFQQPPKAGDAFYLGFQPDLDLRGHVLRIEFDVEEVQGAGVRRQDPPLTWACSLGDGRWHEMPMSTWPGERDTTGGLNNETGALVLYLPLDAQPDTVQGRRALWLRCHITEDERRRPEQGMYRESPKVLAVRAYTIGAATPATHAVLVTDELLGESTGEPGQVFRLQHAPVLELREGETVMVEELRGGQVTPMPWQLVPNFASSDRFDRHFAFDPSTGEVSFGPAIQQPVRQDGAIVRQYGRVPEAGRRISFTRYRYGGGLIGNVPAGRVESLRSGIAFIDRVSNLSRAEGGRDAESLEEGKMRARREMRAQQRAVTAEDFESFARRASRAVARVHCLAPGAGAASAPPGTVELLVTPAALDSLLAGDLSKLALDAALCRTVEAYLEPYRLLTTAVRVREPRYIGVQVQAEIVVADFYDPDAVRGEVVRTLRTWLSPLGVEPPPAALVETVGPGWEGWPFGRSLFLSEVFTVIQRIPGVKHVLDVKLRQRELKPAEEARPAAIGADAPAPPRPTPQLVQERRLKIAADALICSLEHEIKLVEL